MSDPNVFEQESMDRRLRRSLGAAPPPELRPGFDRRLMRRVERPRLDWRSRGVLWAYAASSAIGSIAALRAEAIDWGVIAVVLVIPVLLTGGLLRRGQPAR